jgi:hypothetical protein
MIELRLSDALHSSAATIDPMPDLAAFGVALTDADRTHRRRAVAAVATMAAAACVAGVAIAQTSDASRSVDVSPAQRTGEGTYDGLPVIKDPKLVVPTEVVVAAPEAPVVARPTFDVPDTGPPAPAPVDTGGTPPPAPPAENFTASSAYGSGGGSAPYDYYSGQAPPGKTVMASSPKGSGSVVADSSGHWALKVYFYAVTHHPPGTTFTVTLSTPGFPAQTFSFTYTGP